MPPVATKSTKTTIPKVLKDHTWDRWIGDSIAKTKCFCCEIKEIKMNDFHCGHVIAKANGGTLSPDNLRPICAACNMSMGTENLFEFKKRCGYGIIEKKSAKKAPTAPKSSKKEPIAEESAKKTSTAPKFSSKLIKTIPIPKVLKDLTWSKWIGDSAKKAKCLCCELTEIKMSNFHCGHVIAEANGGKLSIDNLRPICAACNMMIGNDNLYEFKERCGFGTPKIPDVSKATEEKPVKKASAAPKSSKKKPTDEPVVEVSDAPKVEEKPTKKAAAAPKKKPTDAPKVEEKPLVAPKSSKKKTIDESVAPKVEEKPLVTPKVFKRKTADESVKVSDISAAPIPDLPKSIIEVIDEPVDRLTVEDPIPLTEDILVTPTTSKKPDVSKVKKTSIPKALKELVWKTWAGGLAKKAKCMCCKLIDIKTTTYYCGYVIAEANGGSPSVDNLRPICAGCNMSIGNQNLDEFKARHGY